jgi:hypothetical protein
VSNVAVTRSVSFPHLWGITRVGKGYVPINSDLSARGRITCTPEQKFDENVLSIRVMRGAGKGQSENNPGTVMLCHWTAVVLVTQTQRGSNRLYVTTAAKPRALYKHETVKTVVPSRNPLTNGELQRHGHLEGDETEERPDKKTRYVSITRYLSTTVSFLSFWGVSTTTEVRN